MDFSANKRPVEVIKKVHLEELILETFILILVVNGMESNGKNSMS